MKPVAPVEPIAAVYRDGDWLAVIKPAGIPTTAPPTAGVVSLVDRVRNEHAAGSAHLHPLSRLDVEVTGVVLFALTDAAIERARVARETGTYQRTYFALLAALPTPRQGVWEWPVGVDPSDRTRRTVRNARDPQRAKTEYRVLAHSAIAWVSMDLRTGRTHQVRVHAREAGCPVVGDRTYGGPRHIVLADGTTVTARRVMLHARRVGIPGSGIAVEASVPEDFAAVWRAVSGLDGAPDEHDRG